MRPVPALGIFRGGLVMNLTDNELSMLDYALKQISFIEGPSPAFARLGSAYNGPLKHPEQVRLERKLERWREHPDLIFT